MGHVVSLSEAARVFQSRHREPVPQGGATISLFLGVRYERWDTSAIGTKRDVVSSPHTNTEQATAQGEIAAADVA
ncbi:MAG: hypothetical protein JOY76_02125 [Hyphomicrobiales bacterium]|nr:hypothetical protein [Hyphomicrobiales bacterium]MBV8426505.1 hypothetical protein [Hyphomicrobiales bacterium]